MTAPSQHDPAQIQQDWQQATAEATEVGYSPLLVLGMDRRLLNDLPVLTALVNWQQARNDVTQPLLLTGGVDALWPVPLLYSANVPPAQRGARAAPPLQLRYGGADEATLLATLTTCTPQRLQNGLLYAVDVPPAMQPLINQQSQRHVNAGWHTIALASLQRAESTRNAFNQQANIIALIIGGQHGTDEWLGHNS